MQVYTGTWAHDLEQASLLPREQVSLNVTHLDSHRLARFLDSEDKLLPLVHDILAGEMGYETRSQKAKVRLANLL